MTQFCRSFQLHPFNHKMPGHQCSPMSSVTKSKHFIPGRPDEVDDFALLGMHLCGDQGVREGQFLHGLSAAGGEGGRSDDGSVGNWLI